ncbi:WAP four-disulfide core domain protein 8-like [Sarcophilus harrisii]|uniref:WAP four-disulfide core domain 8 n=1 Tax=Sarcophilus harrisii TaxID=9305 RepID=G3VFV2_SARHA|nr:WAP four-disulfide core domain protein 8-like [Sarcophilus harrisii]
MFFWILQTMTAGTRGNRAKSPHHTWFWKRVINIFLILSLSLKWTHGFIHKNFSVPRRSGICPTQNITCDLVEKDQCVMDFDCKSPMKCCKYNCGKKCLKPYIEICLLIPEVGDCENFSLRWFYSTKARACKHFFYSGCDGNVNNFPTKKICEQSCAGTVRPGKCPPFPFKGFKNCSVPCHKDQQCQKPYKCCASSCGFVCTPPWKVKPWDCPPQPSTCMVIQKPLCQNDEECGTDEKCCTNCGFTCIKRN